VEVATVTTLLNTGGSGDLAGSWQVTAVTAAGPQETQSVTHVVPAQLSQHRNLGWPGLTALRDREPDKTRSAGACSVH